MALLKVGEKDRDGRQKRIEHTGRYLRASRTGGLSLRAQTRAAGINLTGNTNHGVRVSTRLAKNTQVAFQNGRFILRGRYGSDAAKFNLSKSGVTVSTKTPIGSFNWIRPGRSSAKIAGVQLRGHNAAAIQGIFALFASVYWLLGGVLRLFAGLIGGIGRLAAAAQARRQLAEEEAARPEFSFETVRALGDQVLAEHEVDPSTWSGRDQLATLAFAFLALGRGAALPHPSNERDSTPAVEAALFEDMQTASEHWRIWLGPLPPEDIEPAMGIVTILAQSLGQTADSEWRGEVLLALDDACLRDGPKTLLQEAMIDLTAEAMGVELVLEGEQ
ncbi:conserved hypothetical protein [Thioalkalivibrio sp. K90mix]|uniref:hypothetical protein n=1 Tax=unclassified Thioalkalivibrio TaxID=2621013 RepID=UPI000195A436|nr:MULTISPECIES: hypothetical protein [unclassified Thioalkalivibrio]ADC71623.1 conserved hypothetical protein [Thioalkalivibrio sp. K90mix]